MKTLLATIAILLPVALTFSCEQHQGYFFPENNLWIPLINQKESTGLSEQEYNLIIDRFEAIYIPYFKNLKRGSFKINRNWRSKVVNARAQKKGRKRNITMFGGMARHPLMTKEAFKVVLCHEIGHHLGGAPLAALWAATEGQSDYFATSKCMRKYYEKYGYESLSSYSPIVEKKCSAAFTEKNQQEWCKLSASGSQVIGAIFAELRGVAAPKLAKQDTTQVKRTNYRYPGIQCRLDTFFAGALCPIDHHTPFGKTDDLIGACHPKKGDISGFRPTCWYSYR